MTLESAPGSRNSSPSVHGPFSLLPTPLKILCSQLLPRLRLIPELHVWFRATTTGDRFDSPVRGLWEGLVHGRSLQVLLDLVGSSCARISSFDGASGQDQPEEAPIAKFIEQVRIMELQGRIPHGDTLRLGDFYDGSALGFTKVLRTVQRITNCLEATYPGLYELPHGNQELRDSLLSRFVTEEEKYLSQLVDMDDCVTYLRLNLSPPPTKLQFLSVFLERMQVYHSRITARCQQMQRDLCLDEHWDTVFGLDEEEYFLAAISSYNSYSSEYPSILDLTDSIPSLPTKKNHVLQQHASTLAGLLPCPMQRLGQYTKLCSDLLCVTQPAEKSTSFNSLCAAHSKLVPAHQSVMEAATNARTMWTVKLIDARGLMFASEINLEDKGEFILDDCLGIDLLNEGVELECSAFLFEEVLLLCRLPAWVPAGDVISRLGESHRTRHNYPVEPWDLGPGVRSMLPLELYRAIQTNDIKRVYRPEEGSLSIDLVWLSSDGANTTVFNFDDKKQMEEWVSSLKRVAPVDAVSLSLDVSAHERVSTVDSSSDGSNSQSSSVMSDFQVYLETGPTRFNTIRARPWSLLGRKEPTPAPSMFSSTKEDLVEARLAGSPNLLPQLFNYSDVSLIPRSLAINTTDLQRPVSPVDLDHVQITLPPTPPPDSLTNSVDGIPVLDLTGQITRLGQFPSAHGGYADVWLGEWKCGEENQRVAVKVLRGKIYDEEREGKMKRRLRRELRVWQRLNHPNVLPLYGTCSDFGSYTSMVCPWRENGTARLYLQKYGERVGFVERLRMLCDVVAGLSYLHSRSVVHGDLTGSNILIDDHGRASLCDFGLSTVVEEFLGTSYFTSNVGGAIRWAAPELFRISTSMTSEDGSASEDVPLPQPTPASDIYSFGSVTLEVLTGSVPYSYLRTDGQVLLELSRGVPPQRPRSSPFVTDKMWRLMRDCWSMELKARPSTMEVCDRLAKLYGEAGGKESL